MYALCIPPFPSFLYWFLPSPCTLTKYLTYSLSMSLRSLHHLVNSGAWAPRRAILNVGQESSASSYYSFQLHFFSCVLFVPTEVATFASVVFFFINWKIKVDFKLWFSAKVAEIFCCYKSRKLDVKNILVLTFDSKWQIN